MGQCTAAIAEAIQAFGRIDILLCCKSEGELMDWESLEARTGCEMQRVGEEDLKTRCLKKLKFC